MADEQDALDSDDKVKDKVMDESMSEMAHLASFLGYGNANGCWAEGVGEDFKRDGTTWKGQDRWPCPINGADKMTTIGALQSSMMIGSLSQLIYSLGNQLKKI